MTVKVPHPAESGAERDPDAGHRRDVDAEARVSFRVVEAEECGTRLVVVSEFELTDLRRDHRPCAG